jgi:GrpB-like predicted nucleotidyltransferase (UPF0157 family)
MTIISKKIAYTIEKYNPDWVNKYIKIKNNLQKVFGEKALMIEHVGSTSIVGMKAKPLIDVLLVVKNINDISDEIEKMKSGGYSPRKDVIDINSLLFEKGTLEDKTVNIHVFEIGTPRIDRFLDTRDYLRSHPERVKEYEELKQKIYQKFPDDYHAYRDAKSNFMEETNVLANNWVQGI